MAETQTATQPASTAPAPTDTLSAATTTSPPAAAAATTTGPSFTGDDLLPDAEMVYDQRRAIKGSPEDVWPWIVQWGKGRGGWYVPAKFEKVLPEKFRSAPAINPEWQTLSVGDKVPDYGLAAAKTKKDGKEAEHYLEVALVDNQRALVYKGDRTGITFTWALLLEDADGNLVGPDKSSTSETILHLRFRGRSQQSGWKGKVALQVGKVADGMMASAMFPGIVDRVEQQDKKEKS